MATMYSLFFGLLFTALCCDNGDGSGVLVCPVHSHPSSRLERSGIEGSKNFTGLNYNKFLCRSVAAAGPVPFLSTEKGPNRPKGAHGHPILFKLHKGQGLVARLNCLLISSNKTTEGWRPSSAKLNPLRSDRSDSLSGIIDNSLRLEQHRPIYSDLACSDLQSTSMSPVKILVFKDDILAYGVKGRKAMNSSYVHFALEQDFQSRVGRRERETLETTSVALRSRGEHRLNSLDLCGTFDQGKVPRRSANEEKRNLIIAIASKELGVREATGNNDGPRIEEYLRYTNLGPHHDWCAAYVSWVYGQAGLSHPRNPWSPALFPKARQVLKQQCQPADLFGIYGAKVKRINHVGMIKKKANDYMITIEGNSNNRVESRRRHFRTIYAIADWVSGNQS